MSRGVRTMPAELWRGVDWRVDDFGEDRGKQIGLTRIGVAGAPKCSFQAQRACPPYSMELLEESREASYYNLPS